MNVTSNHICGVCEKTGGDQIWPNHKSKFAHKECVNQINDAQQNVIRDILDLFKSFPISEKHGAFLRVVTAVREACQCSLLEFVKKNGIDNLKELFETIGAKALFRKSKY